MKVIFLDVDGVLNCQGTTARCGGLIGIDSAKVKLLKQIVDATGAKIVLSSSWRLGYNRDGEQLEHHAQYLERKLNAEGLQIYDVTKSLRGMYSRVEEVYDYMSDKDDIENFVILDDEDFNWKKRKLKPHWVKSTFYGTNGGIHEEHVKKAIRILNSRLYRRRKSIQK